ncbi:MAG: molybdopterin oxidoreductase family protein [Pirellulaceae bacterium]
MPGQFGLGQLPVTRIPDATTTMVCGYCATGCSLDIHLRDGRAVNLSPTRDYPVNLGTACPKGWESLSVLAAPDRATTPLLRMPGGERQPIGWDQALRVFCDRIRAIQRDYGPESVAFLSTGQLVTEEMALLGALAKFGMGMVHGDGNTRQCMATAATAYKQSFGFDAPPYTYQDLEESDVIVLVGSNMCIAHPIMWERICRNRNQPRIVVIDPRATETASAASLHLSIRPKSDLALFYGIANLLISRGWYDQDFVRHNTSQFEAFAGFVQQFPLDRVAEETGLSREMIEKFTTIIHNGARVSFWWTMGVNQSHQGVRTAQSLINLALLTGNIGRPGTGANSITGQCNAMGSRLFSNTTNLLGGRDFTCAADRQTVAERLRIDPAVIPTINSWPYHRILEGIHSGNIRALWVICTNPAHSWIDQYDARQLLQKLDFLVVQDIYHSTETAVLADLLLPAAAWGEKEGTFINSERRIGVVKRVAQAPGQALADFSIFRLIAEYWGCGPMFAEWKDPATVFHILKELSRTTPCDFSGIEGYPSIERAGGVQWPCQTSPSTLPNQRRLFGDGRFYHTDQRARFIFDATVPPPELPDEQYPFVALTGRGSVSQWHTQTRTNKSPVLRKMHPARPYVELHPDDARRLNIHPHDIVTVRSRRGAAEVTAFITPTVGRGQVFLPMHYETTNRLTLAHFDPHSHQPSYKYSCVNIQRANQAGHGSRKHD